MEQVKDSRNELFLKQKLLRLTLERSSVRGSLRSLVNHQVKHSHIDLTE